MSVKKVKPPVPKFNLEKLDNLSIDETQQIKPMLKSDKRRFKEVLEHMDCIIEKLNLGEWGHIIRNVGIKMITQSLLEEMKSRKYSSIAAALIIHSTRILLLPVTVKNLLSLLDVNEKQVRKILSQLERQYPYNRNQYILSYISRICLQLGFTFKFQNICALVYDIINYKLQLIEGEQDHVISAAIIKTVGDIIFASKGGLIVSTILQCAGCCEVSLKNFLKKIEPHFNWIGDQVVLYYQRHLSVSSLLLNKI